LLLEIVLCAKLSEIYPDLYRSLSLQAVTREDRLPLRFTRHIRQRALGKDSRVYLEGGGRQPQRLPPQDPSSVRGTQHRLPF
jgi:hypothetical protein